MEKKTKKNAKNVKEEKKTEEIKEVKAEEAQQSDEKTRNIKKDKILIIGIFIIIFVFGMIIVGIKLIGNNGENKTAVETKIYNGYVFEKYGNVWTTQISKKDLSTGKVSNYDIMFHYTPDEVKDIKTIQNTKNESIASNFFINADLVYVTTEPDYPAAVILSGVEIAKIMGQIYGKDVKGALTKNSSNTATPIATCGNITTTERVIYLKLGNSTGIYSEQGCVVVQGRNTDELLKASERLAFEMLKIL